MELAELQTRIRQGEDSFTQLKEKISNEEKLAEELVAFSNAQGGVIIVGVSDKGVVLGLNTDEIRMLNQLLSNTVMSKVKPPINPLTKLYELDDKKIMVIFIKEGIGKPYSTNKGVYLKRYGADKRKISEEELKRLFQESGKLYADEQVCFTSTLDDFNLEEFKDYYKKTYDLDFDQVGISREQILGNLKLAQGKHLSFAGVMLFALNTQKFYPQFITKGMCFKGNELTTDEYIESRDAKGTLPVQYHEAMSFVLRNIRKVQKSQGINTEGELEIPRIVFEEILVNAFIHRDYYINAPIRIFILDNRIEIINPGKLPNALTINNIKNGVSIIRNPILTSLMSKMLPYRGVGLGILRALKAYPHIQFINDSESEQFKVIIERKL